MIPSGKDPVAPSCCEQESAMSLHLSSRNLLTVGFDSHIENLIEFGAPAPRDFGASGCGDPHKPRMLPRAIF